jgi:catechol 2,3-dioxygenase-like lactoylglutathione lyase family enzyme
MKTEHGYLIRGIQQIGIGVADREEAWRRYRCLFGVDTAIFTDEGEAPYMTAYTGNSVQSRTATLAVNLKGGSGFEIWQYRSRRPAAPAFQAAAGDLGIYAVRIKSPDIEGAWAALNRSGNPAVPFGAVIDDSVKRGPDGTRGFFLQDGLGNLFRIVEDGDWFDRRLLRGNSGGVLSAVAECRRGAPGACTGGPSGCIIGVSDIDASLKLYAEVLGFNRIIYDRRGTFADLTALPGGDASFRRVLLCPAQPPRGPFSELFGTPSIELLQRDSPPAAPSGTPGEPEASPPRRIFKDRFWGDLGFIHLCLDVSGMDALKERCAAAGFPFTVDSGGAFGMGEASGRFAYIEDPDGTLIEFVETKRMPILKKLGLYLDLEKRDPEKPLPRILLKLLALGRVRD